jgi:virginiamycin A acetyltransferase
VDAPDPTTLHPVPGHDRVVFLKPLVKSPKIEVGEYSYYDDPDDPLGFETNAVLYGVGPERLIIGRFCAIASGVRFLMPGANHADLGPSTFPFGIFGSPWAETTMDLVMGAPSRGDTVVGHDVWIGYGALILPGVKIGHGAVVAAASVVASDRSALRDRRRQPGASDQRTLWPGRHRAAPACRLVGVADREGHGARADDHVRHGGRARPHR